MVLLLMTVVLLVWVLGAFGSTTIEYRRLGVRGLVVLSIFALLLLPGQRRVPPMPIWFGGAMVFLVMFGSFLAFNAHSDHSRELGYVFTDFPDRPFPSLRGSVVYSDTQYFVLEIGAIALGLLAVARSTESKAWIHLLQLLALSGLAVTLVGLAHKGLGMRSVWGVVVDPNRPNLGHPETYFAPFVYNANAAAFLNLVYPVSVALALRAWRLRSSLPQIYLWVISALMSAAGVVATASKGGFLILGLVSLLLVVIEWKSLKDFVRGMRSAGMATESRIGIGAMGLLFVAFVALGIRHLVVRWQYLAETLGSGGHSATVDTRLAIMRVMRRMASPDEGGWCGLGPGSFAHVFPYYNLDPSITGGLHRGHCDPLQTLVEWGYLGFAAWMVVGLGAVVCGVSLMKRRALSAPNMHLVRGVVVGLIGVGVHSCFDFPLSIFSIHLTALVFCGLLCSLYHQATLRS
ncbi:MAG: O-antigen ligase family protein [Verrucomicrobiaceae bacterium]